MSFLTPTTRDSRRLLSVYIYYRFGMGLLLGAMHWLGLAQGIFGHVQPGLFSAVALFYMGICGLSVGLHWVNSLSTSKYLLALLVVDFIAIGMMIFASGSDSGGLGYLLLIPMAVGSTLLRGESSIGLAAFATLLLLVISLYAISQGVGDIQGVFSAGVTGAVLFVTAITLRMFAQQIQTSEDNARTKTDQAAYLQLISQRIVEAMRTGIVVIDRDLRTQLMNRAASDLLTVGDQCTEILRVREIHQRLLKWREQGVIPLGFAFKLAENQTLKVSFSPLEDTRFPSIMIYIEDMQRLNQEAQQLKLASLGRLSASIAHEIRNPLGAISHAGQLLGESATMDDHDRHLLAIIHNHSQRINFIITTILDFSRKKNAQPEIINLNQWLVDFKAEYQQHHPGEIVIHEDVPDLRVEVDPGHLHQIISNLVDNGMRYSQRRTGERVMQCRIGRETKNQRPCLELIDFGDGIDSSHLDRLFEPFYTTETTGSGLGLYVCKALSEANQALLSYSYDQDRELSIFKLVLVNPRSTIALQ